MARIKKDGEFLNCYIRRDLSEVLKQLSSETSIPKTAIVEKALEKYFADVMKSKPNENSIKK